MDKEGTARVHFPPQTCYMAVGQNQRYHFWVGAPPILEPVLVGIESDVHWGDLRFWLGRKPDWAMVPGGEDGAAGAGGGGLRVLQRPQGLCARGAACGSVPIDWTWKHDSPTKDGFSEGFGELGRSGAPKTVCI